MKVLLFGSDSIACGAGLAMIELAEWLELLGVDVVRVVRKGYTQKKLKEF